MRILFLVKKENYSKAGDIVFKNDLVSRQSINFRDSKSLGLSGDVYYLDIQGSDEALEEARKLLKDVASEVTGAEKEKVVDVIEKQEESANAGFGSIFG